jgi:ADP-ribosylglycohydrolase
MCDRPENGDDRPDPGSVRGVLYGLFIGDALAMPVHWYYDRRALLEDYGRVTDYLAPRAFHPDSILWRSRYRARNPRGQPPDKCGREEKHIGGLSGIVPVIAFYRGRPERARAAAREHLSLTHPGPRLAVAADPEQLLIVNTNLGGDNAGRGAILGALAGAAGGVAAFPSRWRRGLVEPPDMLT